MHIDKLLNSIKQQAKSNINNITLSVPSTWEQGRTLYGGISASLVYEAMREVVDSEKVMRSLSTNFIGPIEADTEFNIIVEVLREGKNVNQVVGKVVQDNKVALMSQASFGIARGSKVNISDPLQHKMDSPRKPDFMPHIPKVTPKFLENFDLAQTKGGWPFTGKKDSDIHGWMRFKANFPGLYLLVALYTLP